MSSGSAKITAKTFENKFNEIWGKYLYAAFADIEASLEEYGPAKYSPYLYQSYKNLTAGDGKIEKLTGRFTISDATRQHLTFLFGKMIDELKNTDLAEDDTRDTLIKKVRDAGEDHWAEFMFGFGNKFRLNYGENLKTAHDPNGWFAAQITGLLPNYVTYPMTIALISNEFNTFLKSLAWVVGQYLYECDVSTISPEMVRGLLLVSGLTRLQRDLITSNIRKKEPSKAPAKPRAKKGSKESTPTDTSDGKVEKPVATDNIIEKAAVSEKVEVDNDSDLTELLNDI